MTSQADLQKTLQSVMDARELMRQFYHNVADLFRSLARILEECETPYQYLLDDGWIWTGEISPQLRTWQRWETNHFGIGFAAISQEESESILLVNVSVDPQFASEPEIWFGVVTDLETREPFPHEETIQGIYEFDFTPDDEWTEPGEWYEEEINDRQVEAHLSFLRIPLFQLESRNTLERFVSQHILPRLLEE